MTRLDEVRKRFAVADSNWWFLITDDDDNLLTEGRPTQFVDVFMAMRPPKTNGQCHYHVAWVRVPPDVKRVR